LQEARLQRKFLCKVGAVPKTEVVELKKEELKRQLSPMIKRVYEGTDKDKFDLVIALLSHLHPIYGQELATNLTMNHFK